MSERMTVRKFLKKKELKEKIVMITAYDAPFARAADEAGVDSILVGDSMAMVVLGMENTLGITLEEMIEHTRAVSRVRPRALIVGDMPFMSYETGPARAMESASLFVKAGADAVKLEGGEEVSEQIRALVKAGIPVMAHIGLTPQRFLKLGGYRIIGKRSEEEEQLYRDAEAIQEAGAFSVVLEYVVSEIARKITEKLSIPTICIGAGPYCDGQVLVLHDVLGLSLHSPPFAKRYADLYSIARDAISKYAREVRNGEFPSQEFYK
ncbi:MAG: 3-methyl-2-oxobutanoate hydroxymethyltransferase [Fervidicoccaceae archaeon]